VAEPKIACSIDLWLRERAIEPRSKELMYVNTTHFTPNASSPLLRHSKCKLYMDYRTRHAAGERDLRT
jgi:hypothetical protein